MKNNIRQTQREIEQQTNIHGHETPEEFLEKWTQKINDVQKQIKKALNRSYAKIDDEKFNKISSHIVNLQKATEKEIFNICQEKYPRSKDILLKLFQQIADLINIELSNNISTLNHLREYIFANENKDVSKEIKKFKQISSELMKIYKLKALKAPNGDDDVYKKDLDLIKGRLYYITHTNQ